MRTKEKAAYFFDNLVLTYPPKEIHRKIAYLVCRLAVSTMASTNVFSFRKRLKHAFYMASSHWKYVKRIAKQVKIIIYL